jgi:hypothetical protein
LDPLDFDAGFFWCQNPMHSYKRLHYTKPERRLASCWFHRKEEEVEEEEITNLVSRRPEWRDR